MPTIQIRNVPKHIYRALLDQARSDRRSVAQQAILVLAPGLNVKTDHRARRREFSGKSTSWITTPYRHSSDPVRLIRQDRER
jgi:hypothetical protein